MCDKCMYGISYILLCGVSSAECRIQAQLSTRTQQKRRETLKNDGMQCVEIEPTLGNGSWVLGPYSLFLGFISSGRGWWVRSGNENLRPIITLGYLRQF